jgi:glucosamine kinase
LSEAIFIGVDGGGTGCRAVIGTHLEILATGRGGPANASSDMASAVENVLSAIAQASVDLGDLDLTKAYTYLGLAGVLTDLQAASVAAKMPFTNVIVSDDKPTTLTGALGDNDGIVAAIGTGSFLGSKRGDVYQFVGGWGLVLSDEASAAWLGRTVLAETLLVQDGMRPMAGLAKSILARFDGEANGIVDFAAQATPADFGTLSQLVTKAAAAGDVLAVDLMHQGADYIERALAVLKPQQNEILCLTGGLGPNYATYLSPATSARLRPAIGSALDGALMLARRMA